MKKSILLAALCAGIALCGNSQSITAATIGASSGQLKSGGYLLHFTIGEPFTGTSNKANLSVGNGFWHIVPATYSSSAAIVYRFIGNGNFSDAANWQSGLVPPSPLPSGSEVIIDPAGSGQCQLNIPFRVSPNAKFSVVAGKRFLVPGFLNITQ